MTFKFSVLYDTYILTQKLNTIHETYNIVCQIYSIKKIKLHSKKLNKTYDVKYRCIIIVINNYK